MGELVYELKYKQDISVADKIVKLLDDLKGVENFDVIVPIPPSNKSRKIQPVQVIAERLGVRRSVDVITDALINEGTDELKSVSDPVIRDELLKDSFKLKGSSRFHDLKVLLLDDLFRSGSTLRVATKLLKETGNAKKVSVLTMTKTRSNR